MDEIIISILVPMYNAETTIEECLTKLLKQCGNTTEVVVLNDGSIDGCEKKLENLKKLIQEFEFTLRKIVGLHIQDKS